MTEHAHRRVAAIRSAQYVVIEREALERGTILTHGDLVVRTSVIVIEHRQRQDFTRLASYSARFTSAMGRFVRVGARPTSSYD